MFFHPRLINPNPALRWAPNLRRVGRCSDAILPPALPPPPHTLGWGKHACGERYAVRVALKVNPGQLYFHLPVICHLRVLPAAAYPPSINAINPLPFYPPTPPSPFTCCPQGTFFPSFLPSFFPSFLPSHPQSLRTSDGGSRRAVGYCSYLLNTIIGGQATNHSSSVVRTTCFFFSFLSLYLECKWETDKNGGKIAQSVIANRGERGEEVDAPEWIKLVRNAFRGNKRASFTRFAI